MKSVFVYLINLRILCKLKHNPRPDTKDKYKQASHTLQKETRKAYWAYLKTLDFFKRFSPHLHFFLTFNDTNYLQKKKKIIPGR